LKVKNLLAASGYSEARNLSLISKNLISKFEMEPAKHLRIENPVSLEYEYMRSSLIPSLVTAIKINSTDNLKLFEIDKVYLKISKKAVEKYKVAAVFLGKNFRDFKTTVELILTKLNIEGYSIEFDVDKPYLHKSNSGTIKLGTSNIGEFGEINPIVLGALEITEKVYCFEMDINTIEELTKFKTFSPIQLNPAQIEDLTLTFPPKTRIGDVLKLIINNSKLIINAELRDTYKDSYTFRIWYQDPEKTLTNEEVEKIRYEILTSLKTQFGAGIKA
jgi:phenylalanyl-tRNA synthetase beta chain